MTRSLPAPLLASLGAHLTRERPSAYLQLAPDLRVAAVGGALSTFGLADVRPGDDPRERLELLEGLLPPGEPMIHVPTVSTPSGLAADLYVGEEPDGVFVLLLDASHSAAHQRARQQPHNAASLLAQSGALQQPVFGGVLQTLDVCVLAPRSGSTFRTIGPRPAWLTLVAGDAHLIDVVEVFPYLEYFLDEAREHWSKSSGAALRSGFWTQTLPNGEDLHFEAIALPTGVTGEVLIVQKLDAAYRERQELLQRAREHELVLGGWIRENNKKEILLGCIVHDLQGPLSAMMGSLSLLQKQTLPPERQGQVVEIGLTQAHRQREMIERILEVFAADLEVLESFATDAARAPDLVDSLTRTAEGFRAAFEERGIALSTPTPPYPELRVVGRADRLDRVIANLLGNALAHAPTGSTVIARWIDEGSAVRVEVADEGPGVPHDLRATLFDRFVTGSGPRVDGGTGLGLYFCRTVVQQWFGEIGFEDNEPRGSLFWFRLPRARAES